MAEQFPQVIIPGTEVRRLASSLTGYEYQLSIALPAGYADTDKTYPALYVLDPHLTFGMSTELTRLLAFGQELPELICIGIGFSGPERDIESFQVRDYVPQAQVDDPRSGGAENSLYRVDPKDRCFSGYSLAASFGLYTLFHHPDTFQRYIIAGSREPEFVVANIQKLEKAFENRNYPNLRLQTQIFDGETHLSVVPYNMSTGLKIVYE